MRFGEHIIKPAVVFFRSQLSMGFVNIKPVVPGHVLVSPLRVVDRFSDLTEAEVSDLFLSTQRIARVVEQEFGASSVSIAIQDGPEAGQTVKHVHVHVLPRKKGDFENNDDVYKALDEHDKDLANTGADTTGGRYRSDEEMSAEASRLTDLLCDP